MGASRPMTCCSTYADDYALALHLRTTLALGLPHAAVFKQQIPSMGGKAYKEVGSRRGRSRPTGPISGFPSGLSREPGYSPSTGAALDLAHSYIFHHATLNPLHYVELVEDAGRAVTRELHVALRQVGQRTERSAAGGPDAIEMERRRSRLRLLGVDERVVTLGHEPRVQLGILGQRTVSAEPEAWGLGGQAIGQ